jgi:hypothetical protein
MGIVIGLLVITSYTYFLALFAFVAPSRDSPLDIIQVQTLNTSNVAQIVYSKGATVRINSSLEKALSYVNIPWSYSYFDFVGNTSFKIIISIVNQNQVPVFLQSMQTSLSPGVSKNIAIDYLISASASSGIYTYQVMVWSDWLPDGSALSDSAWEGTFTVS